MPLFFWRGRCIHQGFDIFLKEVFADRYGGLVLGHRLGLDGVAHAEHIDQPFHVEVRLTGHLKQSRVFLYELREGFAKDPLFFFLGAPLGHDGLHDGDDVVGRVLLGGLRRFLVGAFHRRMAANGDCILIQCFSLIGLDSRPRTAC